jgi:RNA polymerase sigma-70 factor (ECF subfamily)
VTLSGSGALPAVEGDPQPSKDGIMTAALRAELENLYQEHSTGLVRHLAHRTGCDETARDLAQEAFLRLLRLAPIRALTIRQPEAYLKRISTNLLRDWSRSRVRRLVLAEANPEAARQHVDQVAILESRDTLRRLELALSKLKPKTREIFVAHRLDGLSYSEIAEQTGLTVKGVEKQMSKAITKIDRLLDRP